MTQPVWQLLASGVWSTVTEHGYPVIVHYISPWRVKVSIGLPSFHILSSHGLKGPVFGESAVCFNLLRPFDPTALGEEGYSGLVFLTGSTPCLFFSLNPVSQLLCNIQKDSVKLAEDLYYFDLNYVRMRCGAPPTQGSLSDSEPKPAPLSFSAVVSRAGVTGTGGSFKPADGLDDRE